jgi:hypothetical protein
MTPELEQYLLQEADQQKVSIEVMTLQILTQLALSRQKQTAAVAMLQSWIDDEDEEEQQETGQYLITALDEDRLSVGADSPEENRQLFPPELKGISW